MAETIYEFDAQTIDGDTRSLSDFKDKVVLIVNTASKCGFTPQYAGLESLYEKYREQGLEILGFPCNQFGSQEPGSEEQIAEFCQLSFGVSFPMFGKVDVNGDQAHPLYQFLKTAQPGLMGTEGVKWNFTKFLVDREGRPVARYAPKTTPGDLARDIEAQLGD